MNTNRLCFILPFLVVIASSCEKQDNTSKLPEQVVLERPAISYIDWEYWPPCEKKGYDVWYLDSSVQQIKYNVPSVPDPINSEGVFSHQPIDSIHIYPPMGLRFHKYGLKRDSIFDCSTDNFYYQVSHGFASGTFLSDTLLYVKYNSPTYFYSRGGQEFYYLYDHQYYLRMRTTKFAK